MSAYVESSKNLKDLKGGTSAWAPEVQYWRWLFSSMCLFGAGVSSVAGVSSDDPIVAGVSRDDVWLNTFGCRRCLQ